MILHYTFLESLLEAELKPDAFLTSLLYAYNASINKDKLI